MEKKFKSDRGVRGKFSERKSIEETRREIAEHGYVELPRIATFELTLRCNLSCDFCYVSKEAGKDEISFKEIKRVAENFDYLEEACLIGGEPMLRSDILDIVDFFYSRKIRIRIKTNATLLNESIVKELKNKGAFLEISLDGSEKLHDSIRGKGAFAKLMHALRIIREAEARASLMSVITQMNINELDNILKIALENKIKEARFEPVMYASYGDILETASLLGINEHLISVNTENLLKISAKEFEESIKRAKDFAGENGISLNIIPKVAELYPEDFLEENLRNKKKLLCKHAFTARINNKGELIYCFAIRKSFGKVYDNKIEKLWNSNELKKFRRKLFSANLAPICSRCCRLRSVD